MSAWTVVVNVPHLLRMAGVPPAVISILTATIVAVKICQICTTRFSVDLIPTVARGSVATNHHLRQDHVNAYQ